MARLGGERGWKIAENGQEEAGEAWNSKFEGASFRKCGPKMRLETICEKEETAKKLGKRGPRWETVPKKGPKTRGKWEMDPEKGRLQSALRSVGD